jgi:hypothetical protein
VAADTPSRTALVRRARRINRELALIYTDARTEYHRYLASCDKWGYGMLGGGTRISKVVSDVAVTS